MTEEQAPAGASDGGATTDQSKAVRVADVAATEAADVASTAVEGVRDAVGEASTQARAVAGQTKEQLDKLVSQGRDEFRLQAEQRGDQAADQLRSLSEQLTALAEGRPESAGPLVGYLGDVQSQIQRLTSRLEQGGPQGLIDDVSAFARRRPGLFLAASLGAGVIAGRVVRASAANQRDDKAQKPSQGPARPALGSPAELGVAPSTSLRAAP